MGLETKPPPQFGQVFLSFPSTHDRQNMHSNEQIIASIESGRRSLSQHSQFGLSSSMKNYMPE